MNVSVARSIHIEVAPAVAFDFVADYRNTNLLVSQLSRLEPVGDLDYGAGARFAWVASFKGLRFGAQFVVTDFLPPQLMAARTTHGPASACCWRFEQHEGGSLVTLEASCKLPSIPMLRLAGSYLAEQELRTAVDRSLRALRQQLVAAPRPATSVLLPSV